MKILVTGGNGEFCKHLVEQGKEHSFLTPTKEEADIRHYWNLDRYFYSHQNDFDYVIHAGAITRPMVIHEENPKLSIIYILSKRSNELYFNIELGTLNIKRINP